MSLTSQQQREAVENGGDFFLAACPGAGKTRTVGLRLAYRAAFHPDESVAALSHTNTAIEAIRAAAGALTTLPDHYWVGTLHSFLLRFVVYPYGHLYMACEDVPQVAGDPRDWPADITSIPAHPDHKNLRVEARRFDVHSPTKLTYQRPGTWPPSLTADYIVQQHRQWAAKTKRAYWKRGLLSFSDVLWVAFRVLEQHPEIADAVAARFQELIADEVQDTGDLQLRAISLLRAREPRPRLVVVGDLNQAVYEWSGATPGRLRDFVNDEGLKTLPLTANYRSSLPICGVTHRFSTSATPDDAKGPNAGATEQPELWPWAKNNEPELVEAFRERLDDLGIEQDRAAVLAWTNALVGRLNGRPAGKEHGSWLLRNLGSAAVERDDQEGPHRDTFRALDRAVAFVAYGVGQPVGLSADERLALRIASAQLLHDLPAVVGDLAEWNLAARELLATAARSAAGQEPRNNVRNTMKKATELVGLDARDALAPQPAALARTIHDAKGENIAAVLVVAREEDATAWASSAWTETPPAQTDEGTRVAYVAMTRAERLLVLAVPEKVHDEVRNRLAAIGFAV